MKFTFPARVVGGVAMVMAPAVMAANGLYLTGYGAVSSAMSGADIAMSADTGALIANPSGLAQIAESRLDLGVSGFSMATVAHSDERNDEHRVSNELVALLSAGYAQRLDNQPVVLAAAFNVSGGFGYQYNNLNTKFGTVDHARSMFSLLRFSAGAGWEVNERLRLGLALGATYATAEQSLFPNTSAIDSQTMAPFFGVDASNLSGWGQDLKLGLQYDISDALTVGLNYTSKSTIDLDGGKLMVNYEAIGGGRVTYRDLQMEGIELPQEFGAGFKWQATEGLLLAIDANWFDWSNSIDGLTLTASDPDQAAPASEISQRSELRFRSRAVYSIGFEKRLSATSVLRGGYSYVPMVIDADTISPTFAIIPEEDISIGFGKQLNNQWRMDLGASYQPYRRVSYTNPELPFGPSKEANEVFLFHVSFSKI